METFVIATRNLHKVAEIRAMLGNHFHFVTLADFPQSPEVIEDASTFAGNATKKATEIARWLDAWPGGQASAPTVNAQFVLADDSGLEVDALNGAPGVLSARFAALDSGRTSNSKDADNNTKLLRLLKEIPTELRTARFRCVLALTNVSGPGKESKTELFEGVCQGRIAPGPRGNRGFGYDPLFVPDGYQLTFAELGEDLKNTLSHRARALVELKKRFAV